MAICDKSEKDFAGCGINAVTVNHPTGDDLPIHLGDGSCATTCDRSDLPP
jgi:hypothetical protein